MDSGAAALSSTPRKSIVKPMLRLSIPTPNAQFTPTKHKNESSSTASSAGNKSTIVDGQISSKVDNCSHASPNPTNKNNNQSEVEKLIRSERIAQPNMGRSDGTSTSPLANGFDTSLSQHDLNITDDVDDGDDDDHNNSNDCMPSYKSFESDFRRRIDEINAANRFDLPRLKGIFNDFFHFIFERLQSINQSRYGSLERSSCKLAINVCVLIFISYSERSPLFAHIKTLSSSTPNTPSRTSPKPQFSRIISLSPTIHYSIEENATVSDIEKKINSIFIYFIFLFTKCVWALCARSLECSQNMCDN